MGASPPELDRLGAPRPERGAGHGLRLSRLGASRRSTASVSRLVFVTQAVDPSHPVLGATIPKIAALAARVDEVVVLAGRVVPGALPSNCVAKSFAAPLQA